MNRLTGFREYMQENPACSAIDELAAGGGSAVWHLHGRQELEAAVKSHTAYEITLLAATGEERTLHKTQVKFLHAVENTEGVRKRVKIDAGVRARELEPIVGGKERHYVKNKTLYVLMRERTVIDCTLLEGEKLPGLVAGFNRYEIRMHLKGGAPVTLLRHAILEIHDKRGRSQLKETQDVRKDWKKSGWWERS